MSSINHTRIFKNSFGWLDGWMDGLVDGCMDEWMNK